MEGYRGFDSWLVVFIFGGGDWQKGKITESLELGKIFLKGVCGCV